MRGALAKRAIKRLTTATAVGWSAARFLRGSGALILTYHRIGLPGDPFPGLDVSTFRAQMCWLAKRCRPIPADELLTAVLEPRSPRPPVLVTFDDGYLSYREFAYPVLKELGIPALLFLATKYVDEPSRLFWWDSLRAGIEGTDRQGVHPPWTPEMWAPLNRSHHRQHFLRAAKDHLKNVPDQQQRAELAELFDRLGVSEPLVAAGRQMLNWADVRSVLDLTRIGGHSHTHPILSAIGDDELDAEVATCRERILAATGLTPRWFAYPNGRACDYDTRTRAALLRHGFDVAFTTEGGSARTGVDPMALPRLAADGTVGELSWRLAVRSGA